MCADQIVSRIMIPRSTEKVKRIFEKSSTFLNFFRKRAGDSTKRTTNSGRRIDRASSGASHPQGVCRIRKAAEPPTAALTTPPPTRGARLRLRLVGDGVLDVPPPRAAARVSIYFAPKPKVPAAAGSGEPALRRRESCCAQFSILRRAGCPHPAANSGRRTDGACAGAR